VDPLSGCWPHWEKQLAAARREGFKEGVARERGRWVEAINLMVTNEQVREVIIRGVDRARSAKGES
jgi:hypothetical protein